MTRLTRLVGNSWADTSRTHLPALGSKTDRISCLSDVGSQACMVRHIDRRAASRTVATRRRAGYGYWTLGSAGSLFYRLPLSRMLLVSLPCDQYR